MKIENKTIISLIIGTLIIGSAIYFKPLPKTQETILSLDLKDRENGICADMYAEGYDWGLGQIPLQIDIWRFEGKSESSIKELLYDMLKDWNWQQNKARQ